MAFPTLKRDALQPVRASLVGYANMAKSTFLMASLPRDILWLDYDARVAELADLAEIGGNVAFLSQNFSDYIDPLATEKCIQDNLKGLKANPFKSCVVDSVTAFDRWTGTSMYERETGQGRSGGGLWVKKAMAYRMLASMLVPYRFQVLVYVWHKSFGRDNGGAALVSETVTDIEIARLRRNLNLSLEMVLETTPGSGVPMTDKLFGDRFVDKGEDMPRDLRRGVAVKWARRGRIVDDAGKRIIFWADPKKGDPAFGWSGAWDHLMKSIYGGLTEEELKHLEVVNDKSFTSPADVLRWAIEQGVFEKDTDAQALYAEVKASRPKWSGAQEMWAAFVERVEEMKAKAPAEASA